MVRTLFGPRALLNYLLVGGVVVAVLYYTAVYTCTELPFTAPCTRILFIGNSHTFVNDLPGMVAALARAGGQRIETAMVAEGGWTLKNHANAAGTTAAIQSAPWHYIVLQEQSQFPAVEAFRTREMYPAARNLVKRIQSTGATPLLYSTWARKFGWPEQGLTTYKQMQAAVNQGYQNIAREFDAPIAPAGEAWRLALAQYPELELWQPDGIHATEQGTYLAACVFYATLFGQSPEGLSYTATLSQETAGRLQTIAAKAVLTNPAAWNLPLMPPATDDKP
jgi:hypothetical protein